MAEKTRCDSIKNATVHTSLLAIGFLLRLFQQRDLCRVNFGLCSFQSKPRGTIYFREFLQPAGARWPFHAEDVAANPKRIKLTFKSPGVNDLAAFLPNGS